MNVLIINPPIRLTDKPRHIPHGLGILANIIRKRMGITPQFLDLNALRCSQEETTRRLEQSEYDVVLIGGLIPVYKRIIALADRLKAINPSCVIVAGGSAAMSVPELLLRNSKVDVVCAGEGEQVIIDLLQAMRRHKLTGVGPIKGFYIKADGEIRFAGPEKLIDDLDRQSDLPAYDLLPMDVYLANPVVGFGRDIDFISSRGCPFECTFCYQPWGRRFRGHSVDFIIEALKHLRSEYEVDFVSFQDDEFMASRKRVYEFCDRVQKSVPGLLWSCTGRASLVTDEIVAAMRNAGCVSISYGFESGSARMLKSMKKHMTIEQMETVVSANRRHGMMLPVSFIIGMPGEDEASCRETVEFCVRNRIPLKSMMFATPYPGTQLFEMAIATGRIAKDGMHEFVLTLEDARDFTVNLTDAFTDEQLIAKRREMIDEVCSRVEPVSEDSYRSKLRDLFGRLADDALHDEALIKHRAEHGGIDVF